MLIDNTIRYIGCVASVSVRTKGMARLQKIIWELFVQTGMFAVQGIRGIQCMVFY